MRRKPILRIFVPVDLLPDAAGCRQRRQLFDQRADAGIGQVRISDIGVRPTRGIGYRLNPLRLVVTFPCRPVCLNIDGFDDVAAGSVGPEFLDWIVTTDCFVGAENSWNWWSRQPRQIPQPPDMMMTVDGGNSLQLRFPSIMSPRETPGQNSAMSSLEPAIPPWLRSRRPPRQCPDRRIRKPPPR